MAKIIYAVAGEGFGHSSRSHLIGQRLIDAGHDVMFVGSQKSLLYLKQYFGQRVKEVFGLSFAFEGQRIDKSETLKRNLLKLPRPTGSMMSFLSSILSRSGPSWSYPISSLSARGGPGERTCRLSVSTTSTC